MINKKFFIGILFLFAFTESSFGISKDTIYIVNDGWHTGIILKTNNIPSTIWPDIINYRHSTYIDIGWGDEHFYQAPGNLVFLAARAVLWPTSSVIRLHLFSNDVSQYYQDAQIIRIIINKKQFHQLCSFISNSFKRDSTNNKISSDVYGNSLSFYKAKRKYHLFRTCNTWVAIALKSSGLDISSFFVLRAATLFRRLKRMGEAKKVF